jgi:tetratricopeptide (TPR) repeat protein
MRLGVVALVLLVSSLAWGQKAPSSRIDFTREIVLAEVGPARLNEHVKIQGPFADLMRDLFQRAGVNAIAQQLAGAYRQASGATVVLDELGHAGDPLVLTIGLTSVLVGNANDIAATAEIAPLEILQRLLDDPNVRVADRPDQQPDTVEEWHVRIVPPPGFACTPPDNDDVPLGPLHLVRRFTREASGDVSAEMRLELPRLPLSADERAALKSAVAALAQHDRVSRLTCPLLARAHLEAGRLQQAVDGFRELIKLHPGEAVHHADLARVLVMAGLEQAALEEATRAVTLEPRSYYAHLMRGWVLMHDSLARQLGKGFDRQAALAELQRASELGPRSWQTLADRSLVLEMGSDGERYGKGAQLDESIKALRLLPLGTRFEDNLAFALAYAGRWKDLLEILGGPQSLTRAKLRLVAIAGQRGAQAALDDIETQPADERAELTLATADMLLALRLYALAAPIYERAAKAPGAKQAVKDRANVTKHLQRVEDMALDERDPTSVLQRFSITALDGDDERRQERLAALVAGEGSRIDAAFLAQLARTRRWMRQLGLPARAARDWTVEYDTFEKDGDDRVGYHVDRVADNGRKTWFVVRENGRWKVLAVPDDLAPLGRHALRFLDEGDTQAATRVLDWAMDAMKNVDDADVLARPPFARVWAGNAGGAAPLLRLAATLLLIASPAEAQAGLPQLLALRASLPPNVPPDAVDVAILRGQLALKQWAPALETAARLSPVQPRSVALFGWRTRALIALHRWEDLRQLVSARLADLPDDVAAIRARARGNMLQGHWAEFERDIQWLIDHGKATPGDRNELAWSALFHDAVSPQMLDQARRAAELTQRHAYHILHTLAALQAERGQLAEAHATLIEGIEANGGEAVPEDHYVLGRIAEQLGLGAAAMVEYRQVTNSRDSEPENATQRLVERRIKAMAGPDPLPR